MLKRYKKFLEKLDERFEKYFEDQCEFIKCKVGCSYCCEVGDYPMSRLEAEYLMSGFTELDVQIQKLIKSEIEHLKLEQPKMHKCPFLIDKKCSLYEYRPVVCRTHGLAWLDLNADIIRLPYCANIGLNYSKVFDRETRQVYLQNPIKESLRTDSILRNPDAEALNLECGEIRPMMRWFI